MNDFERELRDLLNRHSAEIESDTPCFVLAEYLVGCLTIFDTAVRTRAKQYGPETPVQNQSMKATTPPRVG